MGQIKISAVGAIFSVLLAGSVYSIDMDSARERPCVQFRNTVPVDVQWMMSVPKFYYPLMTRFDLYIFSKHLHGGRPELINEDKVYYNSCINWVIHPENMTYTASGFERTTQYQVTPLDPNFESVQFSYEDGTTGTAYMALTDNSTFLMLAICINEENEFTWTIGSPYKTLPVETVQLIHDHAESLGFKKEYFTGLRYDTCPREE